MITLQAAQVQEEANDFDAGAYGVSCKYIPGYGTDYMVCSDGVVLTCKHGKCKDLNGGIDGGGYRKLKLCNDGVVRDVKVHKLVAEAFIGKRPVGYEVCHCNGNKIDNRVENLRYDSHVSNCADRLKHGSHTRGERSGLNKINNELARSILRAWKTGRYKSYSELARCFGGEVTCYGAYHICSPNPNNVAWRWLRDEENDRLINAS